MSKEQKKFADDGWAIWVDGDDTSTVYINNWLNPKSKSYVDIAVRVRGVKASKLMKPMLEFLDDEKMVAYSETNKESNVGLYEHYGFELKREEFVPKTDVMHYAMVRKPKDKNNQI